MIRELEAYWRNGKQIAGSATWVTNGTASIPATWTGTTSGKDPGFTSLAGGDFRPPESSPLLAVGTASPSGRPGYPFPDGLLPPESHPLFSDVPSSSPYCPWVEELVRREIVVGCGGSRYCPTTPVTREQMAVYVLRTRDPAVEPLACAMRPFEDVPAGDPYCPWIQELARRGVVVGCQPDKYCPDSPVNRQQMSVFIGRGFDLELYGP